MRPETRALYPPGWREISRRIIADRGHRCEECGQLGHYDYIYGGGRNVLTVHHMDGNPSNNDPSNLRVRCQKCHLIKQSRDIPPVILLQRGQLPLF